MLELWYYINTAIFLTEQLFGLFINWDQTTGIVGVSLSVGIQRQVAHGTFGIIAADL